MRKRAPSDSYLRLLFVHPYRSITVWAELMDGLYPSRFVPSTEFYRVSEFHGGERGGVATVPLVQSGKFGDFFIVGDFNGFFCFAPLIQPGT